MTIKIKGTKTYIDVCIEDRMVRIDGEMIEGGFVAFKDSMKEWKNPKGVKLTEGEKNEIISKVIEKTHDSYFVITFDDRT